MKTKIYVNDLLNLSEEECSKIKIHLAHQSNGVEPYDELKEDFSNWIGWNEWRGGDNDFNREYILCLIPDNNNIGNFIFGGLLRVEERYDDWEDTEVGYKVSMTGQFTNLIGRMIIEYYRPQGMGGRSFKYESLKDGLVVTEIKQEPMPGFEVDIVSKYVK